MPITLVDSLTRNDLGGTLPNDLDVTVFGQQALGLVSGRFFTLLTEPSALSTVRLDNNGAFRGAETTGSGFAPLDGQEFGQSGVTARRDGGVAYQYLTGFTRDADTGEDTIGLTVLRASKRGELSIRQQIEDPFLRFDAITRTVATDQGDFLLALSVGDLLVSFRIKDNGTLREVDRSDALPALTTARFDTVSLRGDTYAVASTSRFGEAPLSVHRVTDGGKLRPVGELPAEGAGPTGLGIDAVAGIEIGKKAYIAVSTAFSRIATYELSADGSLTPVGAVTLLIDGSAGSAQYLEQVELGGQAYLFAGSGAGNALYAITDAGTLVQTSTISGAGTVQPGVQTGAAYSIGNKDFVLGSGETLNSLRLRPDDATFEGGRRSDSFDGTTGQDWVLGGGGSDTLAGADGQDLIEGGKGRDSLTGGEDADHLHGDSGADTLAGDNGNDWLYGDRGKDSLIGGFGADVMRGGGGRDTLFGGGEDDLLEGGSGRDSLNGGAGNDTLVDGPGFDRLQGSLGADVFVLVPDGTEDWIGDFEDGTDLIDLTGGPDGLRFPDIRVRSTEDGTLITWSGDSVLLTGAFPPDPADIGLEDFLLPV